MEPLIRSGNARFFRGVARLIALLAPLTAFTYNVTAQVQTCTTSAAPRVVHPEGLSEALGSLTFLCTGGVPGATASVNLFVGVNVNVTNLFNGSDVTASLNNGGLVSPTVGTAQLSGVQGVAILGINYAVPPSGASTAITISGIRAAVNTIPSGALAVLATAAGTGINIVQNPFLPLATTATGTSLLTSLASNGIPCNGSPLPQGLFDMTGLIAVGTSESTLRVTEGFIGSFAKKDPSASNGVRIVVSLSGYPAGSRVFVPELIVGSSGTAATSSGEFGTLAQVGTYTPGTGIGQLLLARVDQADTNGVGGTVVSGIPPGVSTFANVHEVILSGGASSVTYEVVDSYAGGVQTAQVPVYVSVPQTSCTASVTQATITAKLGPVSNDTAANPAAPVPRFLGVTPLSDCTVLGDCNSYYFPQLFVDTTPVNFTANAFGAAQTGYIRVGNTGQGLLSFTTSVTYPTGAATGWLKVSPPTGTNSVTLVLTADPTTLTQGIYTATVSVNAVQYGMQSVQVTFNVGAAGVTVQSVVSAATFTQGGPLTAGSIAALYGLNLTGQKVTVTFDGLPAQVFGTYPVPNTAQLQINLLVPVALGTKTTSNVVVVVDGQSSNSFPVTLAQNSPGVFNPGIENANFSVNLQGSPAKVGSIVAVYMTGLSLPLTGQVTVKIGTLDLLIPQYAGQAPTLSGVEQINVLIPSSLSLTGNSTTLSVCIPALDPTQRICSAAVPLYVTQ